MGTRVTRAIFIVFILSIVAGCSHTRPGGTPSSLDVPVVKKSQEPVQPEEEPGKDGEAFEKLTGKMDEYQDLMAACERLAPTEENRAIRDSCNTRLKALRQELLDLTNLLQVQPK